jgi:PAS domain-containing protein
MLAAHESPAEAAAADIDIGHTEALLKTGALQSAIFNSANFSSIATDAKGVIQIFNVGAERMLGYTAADVMNKITPADISDPEEVIARATALSLEFATPIAPGFEAWSSRPRAGSKTSPISARTTAGSRRWCPSRPFATRRTPSSAIC